MRAAFPAASSRKAAQPLKSGLGEERLALASVHSALADQRLDGQPAGEVTLEQRADAKKPRPEPPVSPATSYVKMTPKRQI